MADSVHHPIHYNSAGVVCRRCSRPIECIDVVEAMPFNIGNAIKYLWRFEHKNGIEDLRKARWCINREIERRVAAEEAEPVPTADSTNG